MRAPKRVSSGRYLDLANLSPDDIDLSDINNSLNYLYRFTGHFKDKPPLTVAQHTKLCILLAQELFPEEREVHFDCLLHDMPEAYYGDIATPLKRLFGDAYKEYTNRVDNAVYSKLWKLETPFNEEIYHKRKICDLMALDIERRAMWNDQRGKNLWPSIPNEKFLSQKEKLELFEEVQSVRLVDLKDIYERL